MSQLPVPQAKRLRPPSWKDSRLVIGVVLVLASVVLGALAFAAVDDRRGVWMAKGDMTAGDPVGEEDLVRVEVQLDDETADYLRTEDGLPQDAVVDRTVRQGEIVPRDALIARSSLDVSSIAMHVEPIDVPALTKGTEVRVSLRVPLSEAAAAGEDGSGEAGAAGGAAAVSGRASDEMGGYDFTIERATVESVPERGNRVIGGSGTPAVRVLVPTADVARVMDLNTEDNPARISLRGAPVRSE